MPDDPSMQPPSSPQGPPGLNARPDEQPLFRLPEQLDFLRNRFILAGLGVLVLLLLTTAVLYALGGGKDAGNTSAAQGATTPDGATVVLSGPGLTGRITTTAIMRNGPGPGYAVVGTITRGTLLNVIGRSDDNAWLQVIYPPGSQLRGWVEAQYVEVTGDIMELAIAGAGPGPAIDVPPGGSIPTEPPILPTLARATQPPLPPTRTPSAATQPPRPPTRTRPPPPTATAPPPSPTLIVPPGP